MDVVAVVALAIWVMLPAYVPNNAAVLVGGGRPIDGGRTFRGRRLLGDGKTWRGTVGGILAGVALAALLNAVRPALVGVLPFGLPGFVPAAAVALPVGALLGDMGASFLKRRLGHERGAAVPGLDQYDLVVGSLGLCAVVALDWLAAVVSAPVLVAILVVTPALHVATNGLAYLAGLKEVPW